MIACDDPHFSSQSAFPSGVPTCSPSDLLAAIVLHVHFPHGSTLNKTLICHLLAFTCCVAVALSTALTVTFLLRTPAPPTINALLRNQACPADSPAASEPDEGDEPAIEMHLVTYRTERKNWLSEATYPVLGNATNAAQFREINALIKRDVMHQVRKEEAELAREAALSKDSRFRVLDGKASYYHSCQVEALTDSLISMVYDEAQFTGGAHPNHKKWTLTYQITPHPRRLKLGDILRKPVPYRHLSALCVPSLQEGNADITSDSALTPAELQEFVVTEYGLQMVFQAGTLECWNYEPTAMLPYPDIRNLLSARTPVAAYAKQCTGE